MTWQTFVFLGVAGFCFGLSGYRLSLLYKMLKAHKGRAPQVGEMSARIKTALINVLGQVAVFKDFRAGAMHATIFWGFLIISIGTVEQFVSTLHQSANFEFVGEFVYGLFSSVSDVLTGAVFLAVLYAAYRRFVSRIPRLGKSKDANFILLLTGSLMVSILLMNAFHFISDNPPWFAAKMPVSSAVASLLAGLQLAPDTASVLSLVFKWIHMLIVLGFAVYIPGSKHLHVLAAGPNTFLRTLDRQKGMTSIPFEDETITQYGAAKVTDLSWKDGLDYYSCTECGRCQDLCPAWNTQKPLSPKLLIMDLRNNLFKNRDKVLAGKYDEVTPVIDDHVTEDVIWACTSCRACEIACPVFIQHTDKIFDIRRNLVMMESKFPPEVQAVFKNMEVNGTPWAFNAADRVKWTEGLNIKTVDENPDADILFWVGCAGAFDDRNKKVVQSVASLMKKAGINFSILGTKEKCTGDSARRLGNEYLFQQMAKDNINTLNEHKVKKIVTSCPHCFNTLKNEYPEFGGKYEVIHHTEMLQGLLADGKIKPTKNIEERVTFHDSCYLGRWNNITEQPRQILGSLHGAQVVEMSSNHDKSMCCGAGGGRMWMEETIGKRVNVARTEQALETKATVVASSCPFCLTMLSDGMKSKDMQSKVVVKDVAELLNEATP